ncbi:hypothetical protein EVAR_89598_1 [Eumeta japonica]|uniref:Uncharacterized protein n=1 Tax=Eumeta variegata TaxID=151549 RepID=A0A4C1XNH0_EUMVA|nr:hypothetical protein EVAR_89598_1 [Eumeta japonica]
MRVRIGRHRCGGRGRGRARGLRSSPPLPDSRRPIATVHTMLFSFLCLIRPSVVSFDYGFLLRLGNAACPIGVVGGLSEVPICYRRGHLCATHGIACVRAISRLGSGRCMLAVTLWNRYRCPEIDFVLARRPILRCRLLHSNYIHVTLLSTSHTICRSSDVRRERRRARGAVPTRRGPAAYFWFRTTVDLLTRAQTIDCPNGSMSMRFRNERDVNIDVNRQFSDEFDENLRFLNISRVKKL